MTISCWHVNFVFSSKNSRILRSSKIQFSNSETLNMNTIDTFSHAFSSPLATVTKISHNLSIAFCPSIIWYVSPFCTHSSYIILVTLLVFTTSFAFADVLNATHAQNCSLSIYIPSLSYLISWFFNSSSILFVSSSLLLSISANFLNHFLAYPCFLLSSSLAINTKQFP